MAMKLIILFCMYCVFWIASGSEDLTYLRNLLGGDVPEDTEALLDAFDAYYDGLPTMEAKLAVKNNLPESVYRATAAHRRARVDAARMFKHNGRRLNSCDGTIGILFYESYGDTWDGAKIYVHYNDVTPSEEYTIDEQGTTFIIGPVCVDPSELKSIELQRNSATWTGEIGFEIWDNDNNELYSYSHSNINECQGGDNADACNQAFTGSIFFTVCENLICADPCRSTDALVRDINLHSCKACPDISGKTLQQAYHADTHLPVWRRTCASCTPKNKLLYYVRKTPFVDGVDIDDYLNVIGAPVDNNVLHWDYELYDNSEDALTAARAIVAPKPTLVNHGGEPTSDFLPLSECEADCDDDTDCKTGLTCFRRTYGDQVPGCTGSVPDTYDACIKPYSRPFEYEFLGTTPSVKLERCQGDCDSDDDCIGHLKCHQRDSVETPGCFGTQVDDYDYCYDPTGQVDIPAGLPRSIGYSLISSISKTYGTKIEMGGSYCTYHTRITPDLLPESSELYDPNRKKECAKRCVAAFNSKFFSIQKFDQGCLCATDDCTSQTSDSDYLSYRIETVVRTTGATSFTPYECGNCYPRAWTKIDGVDSGNEVISLRAYAGCSYVDETNTYPDGTSTCDAGEEKRIQECANFCSTLVIQGATMKGFMVQKRDGRCYCVTVDKNDPEGFTGQGGLYSGYYFDTPSVDWNLFADGSCSIPCANEDGTQINAKACECGSEMCQANQYCHKDAGDQGTCLANPVVCANEDGTQINAKACGCGSEVCQANQYCHKDAGDQGTCLANPVCANQDGTQSNAGACACEIPGYELIQAHTYMGSDNNKYAPENKTIEECFQTCLQCQQECWDGTVFDCAAFTFQLPSIFGPSGCILYSVEPEELFQMGAFYSSYRIITRNYTFCTAAETMCYAGTCGVECPTDSAATEECICGSEKCSIGQACHNGQCLDVCVSSDNIAESTDCMCGTSQCEAGKTCLNEQCLDVCTTEITTAQSSDCMCGSSKCEAGKFCANGVCLDTTCPIGVQVPTECACDSQFFASRCFKDRVCLQGTNTNYHGCYPLCEDVSVTNLCACGIGNKDPCFTGEYCVNGQCIANKCPENTAYTNDCVCGNKICEFANPQGNKYCAADICNDGSNMFGQSKNWGVTQQDINERNANPSLGIAPLCDAQYCHGLTMNPSDCICGESFNDPNRFFCQTGKYCNKYETVIFLIPFWGSLFNYPMYDGGVPGKDGLARPEGRCDYSDGLIRNTKPCWCVNNTVTAAQPSLGHRSCLGDCNKYCYKGHFYDNAECSNTDRTIKNAQACRCEQTSCGANQYCDASGAGTCYDTPLCSYDTKISELCDCDGEDCGANHYCLDRGDQKICRSSNIDCNTDFGIINAEACLCGPNLQVSAPNMYCDGQQFSNHTICELQTGFDVNSLECHCSVDLSGPICDAGDYCNAGHCKSMPICEIQDGMTQQNSTCWCGETFGIGTESSAGTYCNSGQVRSQPLCFGDLRNSVFPKMYVSTDAEMQCDSNPCVRGTCKKLDGGTKCVCPPGYEGERCELPEIESPCSEGAYVSSTYKPQTGLPYDKSAEYCLRSDKSNWLWAYEGSNLLPSYATTPELRVKACYEACTNANNDNVIYTNVHNPNYWDNNEWYSASVFTVDKNTGTCNCYVGAPSYGSCPQGTYKTEEITTYRRRDGYTIEHTCETPCSPNPCNSGSCTEQGNSFFCSCPRGYEGERCEHHMSESPCSEGEYISSTFSRQTGLSEDVSAEYCMREDYSKSLRAYAGGDLPSYATTPELRAKACYEACINANKDNVMDTEVFNPNYWNNNQWHSASTFIVKESDGRCYCFVDAPSDGSCPQGTYKTETSSSGYVGYTIEHFCGSTPLPPVVQAKSECHCADSFASNGQTCSVGLYCSINKESVGACKDTPFCEIQDGTVANDACWCGGGFGSGDACAAGQYCNKGQCKNVGICAHMDGLELNPSCWCGDDFDDGMTCGQGQACYLNKCYSHIICPDRDGKELNAEPCYCSDDTLLNGLDSYKANELIFGDRRPELYCDVAVPRIMGAPYCEPYTEASYQTNPSLFNQQDCTCVLNTGETQTCVSQKSILTLLYAKQNDPETCEFYSSRSDGKKNCVRSRNFGVSTFLENDSCAVKFERKGTLRIKSMAIESKIELIRGETELTNPVPENFTTLTGLEAPSDKNWLWLSKKQTDTSLCYTYEYKETGVCTRASSSAKWFSRSKPTDNTFRSDAVEECMLKCQQKYTDTAYISIYGNTGFEICECSDECENTSPVYFFGINLNAKSYTIIQSTTACGSQVLWTKDVTKNEDRTIDIEEGARLLWRAGKHNGHSGTYWATGGALGFDMCLEVEDIDTGASPYCVPNYGCVESPFQCPNSASIDKTPHCKINHETDQTLVSNILLDVETTNNACADHHLETDQTLEECAKLVSNITLVSNIRFSYNSANQHCRIAMDELPCASPLAGFQTFKIRETYKGASELCMCGNSFCKETEFCVESNSVTSCVQPQNVLDGTEIGSGQTFVARPERDTAFWSGEFWGPGRAGYPNNYDDVVIEPKIEWRNYLNNYREELTIPGPVYGGFNYPSENNIYSDGTYTEDASVMQRKYECAIACKDYSKTIGTLEPKYFDNTDMLTFEGGFVTIKPVGFTIIEDTGRCFCTFKKASDTYMVGKDSGHMTYDFTGDVRPWPRKEETSCACGPSSLATYCSAGQFCFRHTEYENKEYYERNYDGYPIYWSYKGPVKNYWEYEESSTEERVEYTDVESLEECRSKCLSYDVDIKGFAWSNQYKKCHCHWQSIAGALTKSGPGQSSNQLQYDPEYKSYDFKSDAREPIQIISDSALCSAFYGFELKGEVAISNCAAGKYKSDDDSCEACPAGYWSSSSSTYCSECEAGKYSVVSGAIDESVCTECPIGYYSNSCESHDEALFYAIPNDEFKNGYRYLGDGSCQNVLRHYPTRLHPNHPRYDPDGVKECVDRCLFLDETIKSIFVQGDEMLCSCASDLCLERNPSPRGLDTQLPSNALKTVYTAYHIVHDDDSKCSRQGGQTSCSVCPPGTFSYDPQRSTEYRPVLVEGNALCNDYVVLPNLPKGTPGTFEVTPWTDTRPGLNVLYSSASAGYPSNFKDGIGLIEAYKDCEPRYPDGVSPCHRPHPNKYVDECAMFCSNVDGAKGFILRTAWCQCSGVLKSEATEWVEENLEPRFYEFVSSISEAHQRFKVGSGPFGLGSVTFETPESCMARCKDAYPDSNMFNVRNTYSFSTEPPLAWRNRDIYRPFTDHTTCGCAVQNCPARIREYSHGPDTRAGTWDTYRMVNTLDPSSELSIYRKQKFAHKGYSRSTCLSCAKPTAELNMCPKCKTTTGKRKVSEDFPGMYGISCQCGTTVCSNDAYCLVNDYGSFCNTKKLPDEIDWKEQCHLKTFASQNKSGFVAKSVFATPFIYNDKDVYDYIEPLYTSYCTPGYKVTDQYCLCGNNDNAKLCPKDSFCVKDGQQFFCNEYAHVSNQLVSYIRSGEVATGSSYTIPTWKDVKCVNGCLDDTSTTTEGYCFGTLKFLNGYNDWEIVDDRLECRNRCAAEGYLYFSIRRDYDATNPEIFNSGQLSCACASTCDYIDNRNCIVADWNSGDWEHYVDFETRLCSESSAYDLVTHEYSSYKILENIGMECESNNKMCKKSTRFMSPDWPGQDPSLKGGTYCEREDQVVCNTRLDNTQWLDTTYNLETYPLGRPVGFIECNDAAPPLEACSSESDFDEAFNPGRWSTPGQFYCNSCKAGYEPTRKDVFKLMPPDYEATEHIECSPCKYNEGKYSDEHGLKECKNMLGCSRGHSFKPQHMFEYTLPFESTLKDNMKIDFEGNTQKNAYVLKYKFPEYMRKYVNDDLLDLGGGCAACPTGFFSEMSDFSEDCVEKSRTCLGSYYPACARAENENHLCHGSGIFALKAESDILYRECKHDLCADRMSYTVTDWDEDGIKSSNDHANFMCMDVMSESFLPRNTGNCIASDGGRDPDGGVRDRECYPCPPGTYSDVEDAVTCKTCPTGQFQPGRGMDLTSCIECGAGTYQDQEGQTTCKYCNASESSDVGSKSASACVACEEGRFMSSTEVAYVRRFAGWCKNPFHTFCWDHLNPKYSDEEWRNEPSADKDVSDISETCPLFQQVDIQNIDNIAKTKDMIYADACANACRSFPGFIVYHAPDSPTNGRCYCSVSVHPNCDVKGVDSNVAGEWVTYAMGNEDGSQPGCTECPPGTFSGATDPLCIECPHGKFSTGSASACTDWSDNCDLGHEAIVYPTKTNDLECHECRPGFFRDNMDTVDERDNFLIHKTTMVSQTQIDFQGEFVDEFVPLLVQETASVETCVFDGLNIDHEKTICPSVLHEEWPDDVGRCPAGTFVYHYGSHCCRVSVDKDDQAITFESLSCKDNNYIVCPNGNTDGSCSDTMNQFKRSGSICSRFHYRRMFKKCIETSVQTTFKALDASECASMCSSLLADGQMDFFGTERTHYASYKFGDDDSCYCHSGDSCQTETDTDYMLLEINTIVASATSLPTHGPSTNITDNYVSGVRSGMPNIADHVTYFDLAAPFRTKAVQMCEDACNALPTTKSIFMITSKAYSYTDAFEHSSVAFKPRLVNKGSNAVRYGPMRVCEGECNSDNDCDGDLVCFVRRANEPVPGCSGTISRSTNVCIRPITPESRVYPGSGYSLCEGDCNSDAECASGLFCHFRSNGEETPGCTGSGFVSSPTDDICYDPEIYNPVIRQGIGDSVDVVQRVQCFCSSLTSEECANVEETVQVKELGLSEFQSYTSNEERKIRCTEHGLTSCLSEKEYRASGGTHLEDIHCESCPPGRFNRDDNVFDCEVQPCECLEDGVLTIHRECTVHHPSFCDICYQGYELKLTHDNTSDVTFGVDRYIKTGNCCSKFSGPQFNGKCNWCTQDKCLDMVCDDGYADANHKLSDGCEWKHCASWNIASEPTQVCAPRPEKQYFDMNTLGYFVDDSLMMKEPTYEESDDSILRLAKFIKIYYDENWFGSILRKGSNKLEANQRPRRMSDTDIREAVDKCLKEEPIYGNCKDYGKVSNFGVMSKWDVSEVTDMSNLFNARLTFEGDLSAWDTAMVEDMSGMFQDCLAFDSDITKWDVSNVRDMSYMFSNNRLKKVYMESEMDPVIQRFVYTAIESFERSSFNQDISGWNVRSVLDMTGMFMNADSFAQSLTQWKTNSVRSFENMFRGCQNFDGDIRKWNVASALTMAGMFAESAFNMDISKWNAVQVTNASHMFFNNKYFDHQMPEMANIMDLTSMFEGAEAMKTLYDQSTYKYATTTNMFKDATAYQQNFVCHDADDGPPSTCRPALLDNNIKDAIRDCLTISASGNCPELYYGAMPDWKTDKVTDMSDLFAKSETECYNFNADISQWNTANVVDMSSMFASCTFNGDISQWNTANVIRMDSMFASSSFNQDISNWNVGKAKSMTNMFASSSFNQDISNWNVASLEDATAMFKNAIFLKPLAKWNIQPSVIVTDMLDDNYRQEMHCIMDDSYVVVTTCDGCPSVDQMTGVEGCPIRDIKNVLTWYVDGVQPYGTMDQWDTSYVTDMSDLRLWTLDVSADLSGWDVSSVTSMAHMFGTPGSEPFVGNDFGDLSEWDVSSVTSMEGMFRNGPAVSGLRHWDVSAVTNVNRMFYMNTGFDESLMDWNLPSTGVSKDQMFESSYWLEDHQMCANNKFCPRFTTANIQRYVDDCLEASADGKCLDLTDIEMAAWDVTEVTNMAELFKNKRTFDVDIGDWDVSSVTDMSDMFYGAKFFNRNLDQWDTSKVVNMDRMFFNAHEFNGIINPWDISSVTSLKQMFYNARRFSDDITGWSYSSTLDFNHMMTGADIFHDRYECARYFEQAHGFCTDNVGGQYLTEDECANYFAPSELIQDYQTNSPRGCVKVSMFFSGFKILYNSNFASRQRCTLFKKCICKDSFGVNPSVCTKRFDGQPAMEQYELRKAVDDCLAEDPVNGQCTVWAAKSGLGVMSEWNTEKISNMDRLFKGRRRFNADISKWDVRNVKTMREMFMNAIEFQRDISQWVFAITVNKEKMFKNARAFFLHCEDTKCYKFFKQ